ncbi:LytR C-terminal domain-containing protein [Saccharomonospora viridis]|jgi:hypothetical protein|uniref:LytR/CpsA/Psr regulator C-terminal domain-containing protein n=2 Tax=Saccharomonospora viridis TaxID=1852 RepID=C7MPZ4_SACVD|nr:LytR C-terminal domain-containing protein [Saccharomonospora viridis]ACU98417.1 hypothetical protein Svir_34530 [Saccharomonospora viridis DSM 43017]KHF44211.1 hypothetical protein MINT15_10930 [Saccharomonospora viridis]SFP59343.1 LytR cell envelope-related transcriptional attenuator [Saccharomonospora viridis]
MSIFDGMSRPLRAAGLGLLAVAVVAAAIGGVTLVTGGAEPDNAAASSSAEPERTERGTGGGEPDAPDGGAPDGSSPQSPPDDTDVDDEAGGEDGDADRAGSDGTDDEVRDQPVAELEVPVRVYNNSTIGGLAAEVREDLAARGWNVVEIGNYSAGNIPTSTVYFRPGTDEESAARALAEDFGMRVEPRFDGIADASPGVIVIVTKDYEEPRGGK